MSDPWSGRLRPPEPIEEGHDLAAFDSGEPAIDDWLRSRAIPNQRNRFSTTFVVADEAGRVWGYHALAIGSVARKAGLPRRARHGAPSQIPAYLLARLGVDRALQGRGLGRDLLADAIRRVVRLAEGQPAAVLAVDALNAGVVPFYAARGFLAHDPAEPLQLVRPIADLALDVGATST